jgi:hypothetical protein
MDDAFSPLLPDEIAAARRAETLPPEKGELVSPIPANAPPPPARHFSHGEPTAIWIYRDANGAELCRMRFDFRDKRKEFCPLTLWRNVKGSHWRWKGLPPLRPLYGLNQLAARPDAPVVVCEGEKAADAAAKIFPDHVVVTSSAGARAAAKSDWSPVSGRKTMILPDNDLPGAKYADEVTEILSALGCEVGVVDTAALAAIDGGARGPDFEPNGWDAVNAIAEWTDMAALRSAALGFIKPSTTAPQTSEDGEPTPDEAAIERRVVALSGLTEIKYALARACAAKELGIPVGVLDRLVKQARRRPGEIAVGVVFPDVEPWDAGIDAAALLDEIRETIRRFVVCEPQMAAAVTLWIAFTWLIDRVEVAPLLVITAPEMRCGKSQLLSLVGSLSYRSLPASNISSAAVFRVIDAHAPTLILDEADTFMKENEELLGVVNSGHTRQTAFVIRTVGDEHSPKRFSTWGAKAIAGIGRLAQTTLDRAVAVQLKRKLPSEKTERLRHADRGHFDRLCRMLARFALDNGAAIQAARPDLPETLNDRAQDNWEPLLAIADCAGGHWPTMARKAALRLSGAAQEATTQSTELLFDIRSVLDATGDEKISTADLLRALIGKEESPWATCDAGKPMTARKLAKRLGEYSVKSTNVRFGHEVAKGFHRSQFEDAFARYLPQAPSESPATPLQILESEGNAGASECSGLLSRAVTDANLPLLRRPERCSGTSEVADCGGIGSRAATRKSPENNECSGVAEFGAGADNDKPAEPWGEFL